MDTLFKKINSINKITNNIYFKKLKKANLDSFLKSQECFIGAIDNWSKILGLLLFNVPSDKERVVIIKNLYDEHGKGNITESHVNTFRLFLGSLNYDKEIEIHNHDLDSYQHIKKFNDSLSSEMMYNGWISNVATIAIIEYIYTFVSKEIHDYVRNYLEEEQIYHYNMHEILDIEHATELLELLIPHINTHKNEIINGFNNGYAVMNELYESLSKYLSQ